MRHRGIAALAAMLLAGCSASQTVTMYPIQGPLSTQKPLPVVVARADGITGNTGDFSVALPSGEACKGKWSSAAPQQVNVTTASLFTTYGPVAGYAVTASNVPGVNRGEAFAACDRGTTMQVEFYTGSGTANGYGIAKDSANNIYKLNFLKMIA